MQFYFNLNAPNTLLILNFDVFDRIHGPVISEEIV